MSIFDDQAMKASRQILSRRTSFLQRYHFHIHRTTLGYFLRLSDHLAGISLKDMGSSFHDCRASFL